MMMSLVADDEPRSPEIDKLVDLWRRASILFQPGPENLAVAWPNLTMQQLRVMLILYNEGATRVSVLARRLTVSTPTVTGILDRLVRQGLTARQDDPRDRRVVLNVLTDTGVSLIEDFHPIRATELADRLAQLGAKEREALLTGLSGLLSSADERKVTR